MWRSYSSGERGILHFLQNIRAYVWAERFYGDQFDMALEEVFQQEGKIHKIIKRLLGRLKLHKEVHVAVYCLPTTQKRAKKPKSLYTEGSNPGPVLGENGQNVFLCFGYSFGLHVFFTPIDGKCTIVPCLFLVWHTAVPKGPVINLSPLTWGKSDFQLQEFPHDGSLNGADLL